MRGPETEKSHEVRKQSGFYKYFMTGTGLDIGYQGSLGKEAEPVLEGSIGVDFGYPGYDGVTLPFKDNEHDYVFSSHCLEHIPNPIETIREWWRVIKIGGHLIITVPHQFLYEKKKAVPSNFNGDHRRFYTAGKLLAEVEQALNVPNTYRIAYLRDNDDGYNYDIEPKYHADGCYEIELVIKKIQKPEWDLV